MAIAQRAAEEDQSVTDGKAGPLNVPESTVRIGEPHSPFHEAVEKANDIFSMAGADANSDKTAHMIIAAWGTLSTLPEAVRLGKEDTRDQLKHSRKVQQEATKTIFSGIEQRTARRIAHHQLGTSIQRIYEEALQCAFTYWRASCRT